MVVPLGSTKPKQRVARAAVLVEGVLSGSVDSVLLDFGTIRTTLEVPIRPLASRGSLAISLSQASPIKLIGESQQERVAANGNMTAVSICVEHAGQGVQTVGRKTILVNVRTVLLSPPTDYMAHRPIEACIISQTATIMGTGFSVRMAGLVGH